MVIKLGICVAYDWEMLKLSLPAIYGYVDAICLSIDRNRRSLSGNEFYINWEEFTSYINEIDKHNKINIIEGEYYDIAKKPIENESYQRQQMAIHLGAADWYLQLDVDEIIMDVDNFIKTLKRYNNVKRPINIHGVWVNLIKQTTDGFIYSVLTTPPLATNTPAYEYGRVNKNFNIYTNNFIGHITWARKEEEVYHKLTNWSHSDEIDCESFFNLWKALDNHNWVYIKNFHPFPSKAIKKLYFRRADNIIDFIENFDQSKHLLKRKFLKYNNIWFSRLRKLKMILKSTFF